MFTGIGLVVVDVIFIESRQTTHEILKLIHVP